MRMYSFGVFTAQHCDIYFLTATAYTELILAVLRIGDRVDLEVESGKVSYAGVITINEPATFELTQTERPRTNITRENYGDGVSINSLASYEKRVLEELYRQNTDSEWGDVIQRRLNQLEE